MPDGVFHVVEPGQTLWRIARAYGVPLEALARVNGISDPARLPAGRALFVPGARVPLEVPPYPAPVAGRPRRETPPSAVRFAWPLDGGEILSCYGDPRGRRRHGGVDLRGTSGAPVRASRDGVVVFSGSSGNGYGRLVVVDHGDGFQTLYAHNARELVEPGFRVRAGDPIALVGRTGNATTDHLHFEIRKNHAPVDPLPYLGARSCR